MTNLMRLSVLVVLGVTVLGCSDDFDRVQRCEENAHCNLNPGGQCIAACSGTKYCADPVPVSACASGFRWYDTRTSIAGEGLAGLCVLSEHTCEPDGADAGVDAGSDAAMPDAGVDANVDAAVADASIPQPDAAVGTHFDVVYASEMGVGPFTSFGVFASEVVIINTGTTPLQMATVEVSVAGQPSEAPISFMFTEESHDGTVVIAPGEAYGDLDAAQLQALVPETVVGSGNLAKVIFADVPNPDSGARPRTISGAIGLITINGQTAVLPFDVLLREGSSGSAPSKWRRISTP